MPLFLYTYTVTKIHEILTHDTHFTDPTYKHYCKTHFLAMTLVIIPAQIH